MANYNPCNPRNPRLKNPRRMANYNPRNPRNPRLRISPHGNYNPCNPRRMVNYNPRHPRLKNKSAISATLKL